MKVKGESEVAQSCPTLSDHMDCSLPGSSAHGIFQARVLEWGAIAFSALLLIDYNNNYCLISGRSDSKEAAYKEGDPDSIPGLGRSPGEGNGNPLCILSWRIPWTEEPGRLVHGVAKSRTRLQLLSPLILMMSSLTIFSLVACSSQEDFIEDYSTGMEKAMAPHSSTLAWKIPWREEPGRRQSMGLLRVGHD